MLLSSGCDVLDMPIGILTQIDHDYLAVTFSTKKQWRDAQFSLCQTICQFTIEHGDLIASHNLSCTDWDEYGVIKPFQFGAYIGIPIFIDKRLFGTLFYASDTPRENEFSQREQAYLKMMAGTFRSIILKEHIIQ